MSEMREMYVKVPQKTRTMARMCAVYWNCTLSDYISDLIETDCAEVGIMDVMNKLPEERMLNMNRDEVQVEVEKTFEDAG